MIISAVTDPQYFALASQQDSAFSGGSVPSDPEYHAQRSQWDVFPMGAGSVADPEYLEGVESSYVEPIGFTEITFAEPPPPPPPPISVATVGPLTVSRAGGELMTATGVFPTYSTVLVHMGPLGTSEDPLCYGGPGLGYEVLSLDGLTLQFVTPPLTKGSVGLTIVFGIYTIKLAVGAVKVVERNWPGKLHEVRKSFPPWSAMGRRRLADEGLE